MSAKQRRLSFSAPLVVTLAMAPGCVVTPVPAQPTQPAGNTVDRRTHGPDQGQPATTITNPPPVRTGQTEPTPPAAPPPTPPRQSNPGGEVAQPRPPVVTPPIRQGNPGGATAQQQPPTTPKLRRWTLTVASDKSCYATPMDAAACEPKATCNPPPPPRVGCPANTAKGTRIEEQSAGACFIVYPSPPCPPGVACNPPRPQTIECPGE